MYLVKEINRKKQVKRLVIFQNKYIFNIIFLIKKDVTYITDDIASQWT